jgi:signal transduction histidine kinase
VSHRQGELRSLLDSIDRWFLIAVISAAGIVVALVFWLSSRLSRPLVELADKTARVDLDRLDVDFDTGRTDEFGALSRLLGAMTERLRASAIRLKDAERRATIGELARQVNHDIKNGLTPIRNVFKHLSQLLRSDPQRIPDVFDERRRTIESSISYLESLAANYARLYPRAERRPCDVNEAVRLVVNTLRGADAVELRVDLGDDAVVLGDPLAIRRILENLVGNAIDSIEAGSGAVTVSTSRVRGADGGERIRIAVTDTGRGMTPEQIARATDDFYTTKDGGTGLGLSIVRRLVMDHDGALTIESNAGEGSSFFVDLPFHGKEPGNAADIDR